MVNLPQPKQVHVSLNGTVDLVTPPIAKDSGAAITADNVQPLWGGGFGRIEGVEPVDGGPAPHDFSFYRVAIDTAPSASWAGGLITFNGQVGRLEGTLDTDTALRVSGSGLQVSGPTAATITPLIGDPVAVIISAVNEFAWGDTADEQAAFLAKAHDYGMSLVTAPVGDGNLLGVVDLNGELIAFRGSDTECFVSVGQSDHTWTAAPDTYTVMINAVTDPALFAEGVAVTIGATTVNIIASAFAADGQSGALTVDAVVTEPVDSTVTIAAATVANLSVANSIKTTLTAGQRWKFIYHNFYAGSDTRYAYGTNGAEVVEVRPGGVIVPVILNDLRAITDIEIHKNHLFVSYVGGQYGHSVVGEPLNWEILLGAEQFGTGDEITAMQSLNGNYLLIGCANSCYLLAGTTKDDWQMSPFSEVGITAGTLTSTFMPVAHSKNGFINIEQTQAYGDYVSSELSANQLLGDAAFKDFLTNFFAYSHNREHSQVRFYQTGGGSHIVIQLLADGSSRATFFKYHEPVNGVWDTTDATYLAFSDGRIYRQHNTICSFAGNEIYWVVRFAYSHCGSPMLIKTWNDFELQMTSEGSLTLRYSQSLDYGTPNLAQSKSTVGVAFGGGGRWNESLWNDFYWSSPDYITPAIYLDGHSKNISILLSGRSVYERNFRLDGYSLSYIPRRRYRV